MTDSREFLRAAEFWGRVTRNHVALGNVESAWSAAAWAAHYASVYLHSLHTRS